MSKRKSSLPAFLLVFLILSLLGLFGFNYVQNIATPQNLSKANIFERKITRNDLTIKRVSGSSITDMEINIIPLCDVKELELKIEYYNENNRLITTQSYPIGNLSQGQTYTIQIDLTKDFTIAQLATSPHPLYIVSGGVTPLFG